MLQIIFLILTWISAFIMILTAIATLYLWANGRRVFKINLLTIVCFLICFGLLVLVS